jgi:hypothetical protein
MLVRRSATRFAALAFSAFVPLLASTGAAAENLAGSPVIFRSGDWAVHRTRDAMTDKNLCTAIYKSDYGIQLGSHSLTIAVADGLKSVTLRFDDDSAREMRLPKRSERAVSAVNIEGADFQRLQQSSRLRYRVLTGGDNVVEGDIDLSGVKDAYRNIESGCLGEPIS